MYKHSDLQKSLLPVFDDQSTFKVGKTQLKNTIVVNKSDFHFQVFSLKNQIDITSSTIITRNFYLTFPVVTDRIILTVVTGMALLPLSNIFNSCNRPFFTTLPSTVDTRHRF